MIGAIWRGLAGFGAVWRGLAPLFLAGGAILVLLLAAHAAGLRWDPFDLAGRRLERARAEAAVAASDAAARALEARGEAAQRGRLETIHHQALAVERATAAATEQARRADDANQPLDPARAARLGDHDRQLCRLAAALDGCAAATDAG
jgi:hypothetical protein